MSEMRDYRTLKFLVIWVNCGLKEARFRINNKSELFLLIVKVLCSEFTHGQM